MKSKLGIILMAGLLADAASSTLDGPEMYPTRRRAKPKSVLSSKQKKGRAKKKRGKKQRKKK